jgi:hypothetical protein
MLFHGDCELNELPSIRHFLNVVRTVQGAYGAIAQLTTMHLRRVISREEETLYLP